MKKWLIGSVIAVMAAFMTGCTITPEQGKVIAQNAGIYSAVLWISIDNPTPDQIGSVKGLLNIIKDNASKVQQGKTYMEVLYPEMIKIIDEKVKPQDRPLCNAAGMTLLNGLDTLFALHPEWKASQDLALSIVNSYVDGAKAGLSMQETSPVMMQARATATARAKNFAK